MVFTICPHHLRSGQALCICQNETGRTVCESAWNQQLSHGTLPKISSPSDLKQGYVIKATNDIFLHCIHIRCFQTGSIKVFDGPPVLLNEIELAMKFWVKITNVTVGDNVFFKLRLLSHKIGLWEKETLTTAISAALNTFETFALCIQASHRPKSSLLDDLLHSFKPTRHCLVILWKIKILSLRSWSEPSVAHVGSILCLAVWAFSEQTMHLPPAVDDLEHYQTWKGPLRSHLFSLRRYQLISQLVSINHLLKPTITVFSSFKNHTGLPVMLLIN